MMSKHDLSLPVEINSDRLEIFKDKGTAIFDGNVVIIQGTLKLTSHTVTAYYLNGTSGNSDALQDHIQKIIAEGDVALDTGSEQAYAQQAIYDVEHHTITLLDNVALHKDKNMVSGSKLVYNLETGKSQLIEESRSSSDGSHKRVRGVFVPQQK